MVLMVACEIDCPRNASRSGAVPASRQRTSTYVNHQYHRKPAPAAFSQLSTWLSPRASSISWALCSSRMRKPSLTPPTPSSPPSNPPRSVYSAYEHSLLASASQSPSLRLPNESDPKLSLPIDIALETLFSVLLLCVGVVLSSPDLKPIQWSKWASNLERSKEARMVDEAGVAAGNPYAQLEERPGFWDPRGAKKAFGLWVTEGSKSGSS